MTQAVLGQCVHGNETWTDSEAQFVTWGVWPAGRSQGWKWGKSKRSGFIRVFLHVQRKRHLCA